MNVLLRRSWSSHVETNRPRWFRSNEALLTHSVKIAGVSVSREIVRLAAEVRAAVRTIRLVDAIHVATGVPARCDVFGMEDNPLRSIGDVQIVFVRDLPDHA